MKRAELTEFAIEEEGLKLKIKRGENGVPVVTSNRTSTPPFNEAGNAASTNSAPTSSGGSVPPTPTLAVQASASTLSNATLQESASDEETGIIYIKSPMVGTFYRSSSPESSAFVEAGANISENTVVCIIEAMKIMNEIQAETKGTLIETLVESGQPIEYGQRLFKLKAA